MHVWLRFKIQIYSQGNQTIIQDCSPSWMLSSWQSNCSFIDISNVDIAVSLCSSPKHRIESNAVFTKTNLAIS